MLRYTIITLLLMALPGLSIAGEIEERHQATQDALTAYSKSIAVAYDKPSIENIQTLIDNVSLLVMLDRENMRICGSACDIGIDSLAITLETLSAVADHFMEQGQYPLAKRVYRAVIVLFPDYRYRSYTKRAEFALEDIKELQK